MLKLEYSELAVSEQIRVPTKSRNIWRWIRESKPGYICGLVECVCFHPCAHPALPKPYCCEDLPTQRPRICPQEQNHWGLKKWRGQWRRQRLRWIISLVESGKIIVRARASSCVTHFSTFLWRSLPNDDVKISNFGFWQQREITVVNVSFSAFFLWKPCVLAKWKDASSLSYNAANME